MDWELAIRRNREALERIVAALFALVGIAGDGQPAIAGRHLAQAAHGPIIPDCLLPTADCRLLLPRHLHAHVLRTLRAAESAIRRLVVIAAREVEIQPRPAGDRPDLAFLRKGKRQEPAGSDAALRIPAFPLLDPLKRFPLHPPRRASKSFPRIWVPGFTEPAPIPVKPVLSPDDSVDATDLCRRLLSSRRALANLPREARRLARWYQRNRLKRSQGLHTGRTWSLRIGHPPGGRKHPVHAVDDILKECQALALDVIDPPDTS